MKRFSMLASAGIMAMMALAGPANAATVIGGGTDVRLAAAPALTQLGLSFATFGTASTAVDSTGIPTATFLITGGTRNDSTGALIVRHDGSGLNFTANGASLSVGNFLIDTAAGTVSASATANGAALGVVPLFNIGSGLTLSLTSQGAGAFTTVFGAPDLTGTQIGTADVNAVFAGVPEPASWGLMIGGFGLVGASLRRRTRTTVRVAFA